MRMHTYTIDGEDCVVSLEGSSEAFRGEDVVLSNEDTDITFGQEWFERGYTSIAVFSDAEFGALKSGITRAVGGILQKLGVDTGGFSLEKYHEFVDDEVHYKVVGKTRDLFPADFSFDCDDIYARLGRHLGFALTDRYPEDGTQLHIILRLNRPNSTDFNPVHKDIYEGVDHFSVIPRFANFWIPICGVSEKSSLPIVAGSHRLSEKSISRTTAGSYLEGKPYRVNSIVSWDDRSDLKRSSVPYGSALVFSSHLIHGLAVNRQDDSTRVALEFRLFKAAD